MDDCSTRPRVSLHPARHSAAEAGTPNAIRHLQSVAALITSSERGSHAAHASEYNAVTAYKVRVVRWDATRLYLSRWSEQCPSTPLPSHWVTSLPISSTDWSVVLLSHFVRRRCRFLYRCAARTRRAARVSAANRPRRSRLLHGIRTSLRVKSPLPRTPRRVPWHCVCDRSRPRRWVILSLRRISFLHAGLRADDEIPCSWE